MKSEQLLFPLVCALLFGLCNCQFYTSSNCSVGGYDLLPLQYYPSGPAPPGYSFTNQTTADIISINFCAQVASQTGCTSTTSTNPPIQYPSSCQSFPDNTGPTLVLGDATTAELDFLPRPITEKYTVNGFTFSDGVVLTYTGGNFCQKFNVYRTTEIAVVCPPNGFPQSLTEQIFATIEPGYCIYQVVFVSKYGCGNFVAPSCSYGDWDLLPLQYDPSGSPPPGYSFNNPQTGDTIAINFCAQVSLNTGCSNYATGSCQTIGENSQTIGDATKAAFSPVLQPIEVDGVTFTQGVALTYYEGTFCTKYNMYRSTEILVLCPPSVYTGPMEQILTTNEYDCFYQVVFVSQYGCPSS